MELERCFSKVYVNYDLLASLRELVFIGESLYSSYGFLIVVRRLYTLCIKVLGMTY